MITLAEFEDRLANGALAAGLCEDGYTTRELAETTGKSAAWVREAMRLALAAGTWEIVRVARVNLGGVTQRVMAYRPIPKDK